MKLNKKKKKELRKKAMKDLCSNTYVLGKLRLLFGLYDYSDKDVVKTFKHCIKEFIKKQEVDPEEYELEQLYKEYKDERRDRREEPEVDASNFGEEFNQYLGPNTPPKPQKVVRKKKNKFDSMFE